MSVTDPVTIHLKEFNNGVLLVFKHVVHLHFGEEGNPVTILLGIIFTGDMPTLNGCLQSAEITEENISEDGWQA